jgi:GT2 family glycosyltransferase
MRALVTLALLLANAAALAVVGAFTVRRIVYALAALRARDPEPPPPADPPPRLLVLVPCRDEERVAPRLIAALAAQDYPADRFAVVAIDDASADGTAAALDAACAGRANFHVHRRPPLIGGAGKAAALADALVSFPKGDVVAVFDADSVPEPDALSRAARWFADPGVAAVSGRMRVANPDDSAAAYYVHIEGLVHQLVTMRAADRAGGTVALMGTNMYVRRSALERAGGFRAGALLEDTDLTLALSPADGRVRFDPHVVCAIEAPTKIADFARQHVRWQRGFAQSTTRLAAVLRDRSRPLFARIDAALFAMGYLDRPFLVLALLVTIAGRFRPGLFFPPWLWAIVLAAPLVQVLFCLRAARAPLRHYAKLPLIGLLFPLDVWNALRATAADLLGRPVAWEATPRRAASRAASVAAARVVAEGRDVLAVILGYNDLGHLPGCLASLLAQGVAPGDVLYVDNGSTDGSPAFVRSRYPGVRVIETGTNLGYAGGMNVGLRVARQEGRRFALLLNTDVVLAPGAVDALVAEATGGVAAVGGLALSLSDATRIDGAWGTITGRHLLSRLVGEGQRLRDARATVDGARDVDYPYGCAWLVATHAVDRVGLLDEDFFCYHEELEWCFRARQAGYRSRYTPRAVVHHARYRGEIGGDAFKRRMLARNTVLFLRAHGTRAAWARFLLWTAAALPVRLLRDLLAGRPDLPAAHVRGYVEGARLSRAGKRS